MKHSYRGTKIIGAFGLVVILILTAITLFPPTIVSTPIDTTEIEDLLIEQNNQNLTDEESQIIANQIVDLISIIDVPILIPDSDQTLIDQFTACITSA